MKGFIYTHDPGADGCCGDTAMYKTLFSRLCCSVVVFSNRQRDFCFSWHSGREAPSRANSTASLLCSRKLRIDLSAVILALSAITLNELPKLLSFCAAH